MSYERSLILEIEFLLSWAVCFCDGRLSINDEWECMGSLDGCVWDPVQGTQMAPATEWAWRLMGGAKSGGMEWPLWVEEVLS
jgi:hypothetical protein